MNGSPKVIHRDILRVMDLQSRDWLLDAEMAIKATYLNVRLIEMNVFARVRERGMSHVEVVACWTFIRKLLAFRFGRSLASWRREHGAERDARPASGERTTPSKQL